MSKVSNLQRDYLAEIYHLGQIESNGSSGFVTSAVLSERLFASQSTVNRVIERLRNAGLIDHHRYVGVQLTERGRQEALASLRRQAIIETFLVNAMGFGWHEVYEEARRMRHHVSEVVLTRMWDMAGRPARSPFGEWIDGTGPEDHTEIALSDAPIAQDYRIARVLTRQPDRLAYLAALELKPDAQLHLLHKAPFNGPIQIHLEREYRIIGHELAKMLTVTSVI
ncbi:MAG: metal-dependent transcriptional regulator [Chloroflexota bacterium]